MRWGHKCFGKRTVQHAVETEHAGYGLQFYVEKRVGFTGIQAKLMEDKRIKTCTNG